MSNKTKIKLRIPLKTTKIRKTINKYFIHNRASIFDQFSVCRISQNLVNKTELFLIRNLLKFKCEKKIKDETEYVSFFVSLSVFLLMTVNDTQYHCCSSFREC